MSSAQRAITVTVGLLVLLVLAVVLVWNLVFGPAERGFFLMMWGTFTGTGSLSPQ